MQIQQSIAKLSIQSFASEVRVGSARDLEGQSKTQKKKRNSSSERSRSQRKSRSRSTKKHKNKNKEHKKKSHKSRSRSHKKDKKHKQHRDKSKDKYRDRSREKVKQKQKKKASVSQSQPTEIPMPIPAQIPMPPIPGQRKKRQRSRSPLNYYRRNQNNNDGQFWDSFSWVPRMNYTPTVSSSALANTKKMRRLMITNIPYQIGITQDDLRSLITRFMAQNYLKDQLNNCPVMNLQLNETDKSVAVELSSVEQTCRLCKLQKIQLFKGIINGIIRLGDSCYGNNVVTQAQTAAQAQAAAFAAINVLENKKTNFNVEALNNNISKTSTLLRVTNAVTPYMAGQLSKQQWADYEEDLLGGFSQFGTILHHWFVKKDEKDICADAGNLFVEYESKDQAEKAFDEMQEKIYDERVITLYYMPRDLYYKNYKKTLTPPTLLDKK